MGMKKQKRICGDIDTDFIFIRTDTLVERLRRMRAMNAEPSNAGIRQRALKNCFVKGRF